MATFDTNDMTGVLGANIFGLFDGTNPWGNPPTPTVTPPASVAPSLQFRSTLQQGAVDYGKDVRTFADLDAAMQESDDPRLLGEVLLRRYTTSRGKLRFHPDAGTDLRAYLNEAIDDDTLSRIKHDAEMEALQDERFESAECVVTHNNSTQALTLKVDTILSDGPFVFTIQVTQLTAVLLSVEAGG